MRYSDYYETRFNFSEKVSHGSHSTGRTYIHKCILQQTFRHFENFSLAAR